MLQPGDHIGRYEIRATIGAGGFGRVYEAWDPELERPVAIKELSGERWTDDPAQYAEYLERFQLERRVQGQFQHPHIVSVYDMVSQDGDEYLIEELVEGGTLRDLIQQEERLTPERVVQIGIEVCQAIAAAWERDVVHRDIKPSNILLTQDGHAKLTDFGVAQLGQVSQRTQSDNHHPGTPAYMAPEQEQGYGYLDERSDLYSLGLVLYEALTGRSFKRERVNARQLTPELPRELDKVVMRSLAGDPADRYQRAAEFETALRHSLDRPRPTWIWWMGGVVTLLALLRLLAYPLVFRSPSTPTPTETSTPTPAPSPSLLPTRPTPTPTPGIPPALTPSLTSTPTASPTSTATATSPPTPVPAVSSPRLINPPGAAEVQTSPLTMQWGGELPNSDYGFQVYLEHADSELAHASPVLDSTQWTVELAGSGEAKDAVGGWRWWVVVVRRGQVPEEVARSNEWTFYYSPFGGSSSPFRSPLQTPTFTSPLSVPAP
jgi:serine/threonine protein kinase